MRVVIAERVLAHPRQRGRRGQMKDPVRLYPFYDNVQVSLNMVGYGVSFLRFSVASGQDALLTVTSNGQPLPPAMQLSVVRVR